MAAAGKKYTIGELSKISGISTKTLRFYDSKGILNSSERNDENGYRYYTDDQVMKALMIREMKQRGFTVAELMDLMPGATSEELAPILEQKIRDLQKEIEGIQVQIDHTRNTLRLVKQAQAIYTNLKDAEDNFKISIMPEKKVLYTRYTSHFNAKVIFWDRINEIQKMMDDRKLVADGPLTAIFHEHFLNQFFFDEGNLEVFQPIVDGDENDPDIKSIGGFLVASTVYVGKYIDLLESYVTLVKKIEQHGYDIVGDAIEEYFTNFTYNVKEDECITRVSFPVRPKAGS